jgi:hypothetical protein
MKIEPDKWSYGNKLFTKKFKADDKVYVFGVAPQEIQFLVGSYYTVSRISPEYIWAFTQNMLQAIERLSEKSKIE